MSKSKTHSSRAQDINDFVWNEDEWRATKTLQRDVTLMVPKNKALLLKAPLNAVVKKIVNTAWEAQCLDRMKDCNRIVKPFHVSTDPQSKNDIMIFEEYRLGDLHS
jgi:hypothetical protein